MKLTDFFQGVGADLERLRERMNNAPLIPWNPEIKPYRKVTVPPRIQWSVLREPEPIEDIKDYLKTVAFDSLLPVRKDGLPTLVYIKDQKTHIPNKFHIAHCATLQEHVLNGNYGKKYVRSTRFDGIFLINKLWTDPQRFNEEQKMDVCIKCLRSLDYKGYEYMDEQSRSEIYNTFTIEDFAKEYKITTLKPPTHTDMTATANTYVSDWSEISKGVRAEHGYICRKCGLNLSDHHHLLHVHHMDGDKTNNAPSNLKVLCIDCHSLERGHDHLKGTAAWCECRILKDARVY